MWVQNVAALLTSVSSVVVEDEHWLGSSDISDDLNQRLSKLLHPLFVGGRCKHEDGLAEHWTDGAEHGDVVQVPEVARSFDPLVSHPRLHGLGLRLERALVSVDDAPVGCLELRELVGEGYSFYDELAFSLFAEHDSFLGLLVADVLLGVDPSELVHGDGDAELSSDVLDAVGERQEALVLKDFLTGDLVSYIVCDYRLAAASVLVRHDSVTVGVEALDDSEHRGLADADTLGNCLVRGVDICEVVV